MEPVGSRARESEWFFLSSSHRSKFTLFCKNPLEMSPFNLCWELHLSSHLYSSSTEIPSIYPLNLTVNLSENSRPAGSHSALFRSPLISPTIYRGCWSVVRGTEVEPAKTASGFHQVDSPTHSIPCPMTSTKREHNGGWRHGSLACFHLAQAWALLPELL